MFDPIVHAALVVVFTFLVNLVFVALGINLGGDIATQLATIIVGYILSLFGYSTYRLIVDRARGVTAEHNKYVPPFTS